MLKKSFTRGLRGKILAIVTVAFGASLASAMLNVTLDVGDQMNKELKAYGANIQVLPKMDTLPLELGGVDFNPLEEQQFIKEADLLQLKMIFWAHNIVSFSPYLETAAEVKGFKNMNVTGTWFNKKLVIPTGETVYVGTQTLKSWWEIEGSWPADDTAEAMVGKEAAKKMNVKIGDVITVSAGKRNTPVPVTVTGIVSGGEEADEKVFVSLGLLQGLLDMEGKVQKVEVSALTTPDNALAIKAEEDPESLTPEEFETWYCTAYVSAITYQIEEAIPGVVAKPIRQVAQSEGKILGKIQLLMLLLTGAGLISSALGVSGLMTTKVLERSVEIGLMKSLGAEDSQVNTLFMTEGVITGLLGGLTGYVLGLGFAAVIAAKVFDSVLTIKPIVLPAVLFISIGVVFAGSLSAMKYLIRLEPAHVLHGR
ncbi:MAG: ABC transporter permease [Bacillota bacterium]